MLALILDLETTGVSPITHRVIEVACVLYDTTSKSTLKTLQFLINKGVKNDAELVNGITPDIMNTIDESVTKYEFALFRKMWDASDIVVAHNAEFDKSFVERELLQGYSTKDWVCSMVDIKYPVEEKSKGLTSLMVSNCIPIVGRPHRALFDVNMIVSLWNIVPDLDEQISKALDSRVDTVLYIAQTDKTKSFLVNNDTFKEHGFRFDGESRSWRKRMQESEANALPFIVKMIDNSTVTKEVRYQTVGNMRK